MSLALITTPKLIPFRSNISAQLKSDLFLFLYPMKFGELDIHISDKELDRMRHEDMRFAKEFIKDATFIGTTGTGPGFGRNDLYEKNGKLYVIPDGAGVYEAVDQDLHNLKKINAED